jgi:hypothetical protein
MGKWRTIRLLPLPLLFVGGAAAIAVLTACSDQSVGDDPDGRHDRTSLPALIGEQIYACDDGSKYDADFLADGLTLDMARIPAEKPVRLSAPATGLTYVGHNLNVSISGSGALTMTRPDRKPVRCLRVRSEQAIGNSTKGNAGG